MDRYVALIYGASNSAATATAQRLATTLGNPALLLDGLSLFTRPKAGASGAPPTAASPSTTFHLHPISYGGGAVVGTLFPRTRDTQALLHKVVMHDHLSAQILSTRGLHLLRNYWGRYVAFIRDPQTGSTTVLRDPSGGIPCYQIRIDTVDVVFSHVADVMPLLQQSPISVNRSLNWHYLAAHLAVGPLHTRDTGIAGLTEILPGESLDIDATQKITRSFAWHPCELQLDTRLADVETAARELRHTVRACANAWASRADTILHRLSGGLDSSIVLSCLRGAAVDPDVICLNRRTPHAASDERKYARLVARHACVELVEHLKRPADVNLERMLDAPPLPRPTRQLLNLVENHVTDIDLARAGRVDAFWSGQGGDHLFFHAPVDLALADAFHRLENLIKRPRELLALLRDIARHSKSSLWRILTNALRHGLLRRPATPHMTHAIESAPFVTPAVARLIDPDALTHPWLAAARAQNLPPGRTRQIADLLDCYHVHESFGRSDIADVIHPLLSQPVIELCLQIPTYVLAHGGQDRGLARYAFARDLPREIVTRKSKGEMTAHYSGILHANAPFLRELLLNGRLVREQLLDRHELEHALTDTELFRARHSSILTRCLITEVWLHRWMEFLRPQPG